ncbi:MAG: glutamine synthetase III [Eubacteriales bacterium]|nr:glutamine synthetase III [Eubacteriales bacterium]MDY5354913.1 glutamine synthetase III [Eubacteriales bacterium]
MNIIDYYGSMVFDNAAMREYLPENVYLRLKKTMDEGKSLAPEIADDVAEGMRRWAEALGATHYTHWFQPMTGITAEKHDSFISFGRDGGVIEEFSGKALIKGESDASSFPSGGLRATFEARGYTAWDATSYAFIKGKTLCIPTAFCSYGGEALDKKTPLLRSMELINRHAMRIMRLFGNDSVKKVVTTVGAEQEYFLIDKNLFDRREDLVFTGRTLFGAKPPKGQELDDHYYGSIKPRVKAFMSDLNDELWKLGVPAKTEHNEVAPSQHEIAVLYTTSNTATDNNQLMMETMKNVASRHGLACLLHEKPFAGVNGSGKHNNWSMATDTGANLLEPGDTPSENAQFLLFLAAVIAAVDRHQDLLRISVASASNDHRLGADEAPPAIISMFLGTELTEVLSAIENDSTMSKKERTLMRVGVHTLPKFPRDTTDRNRTSPFAFTGNKFEFRSPGSSQSIADTNTVINTIVAEALDEFASRLEVAKDFDAELHSLIRDTIKAHKRIIFNGNNYSAEWVKEADKRGLYNLPSTPDAVERLIAPENISLFTKYGVLTETEVRSRHEIMLESYCKTVGIEALTMIEMTRKQIIPAVMAFSKEVADTVKVKTDIGFGADVAAETALCKKLSFLLGNIYSSCEKLSSDMSEKHGNTESERANYFRSVIFRDMSSLRSFADEAEAVTSSAYWPIPDYAKLLFSV